MTIMSDSLMRLLLLSLLIFCRVSASSLSALDDHIDDGLVACHRPHQIQALVKFKNEFDSRSCNETDYFNGVLCDNTTGAITKLQLPSECLTGILKPNSSLFGFHHLRYLNLSLNNFTSSSLPSGFGNLKNLEVLSLSSNGFKGQVPSSLSNLSMLSRLDLSHNDLTGNFPLVQSLSKLSYLKLSYNYFSGTLDPNNSLFEMHQLRYLDLAFNNFISSLPSEFGNLNQLEFLNLSANGFFGQVPPAISNLTQLKQMYLYQNKFTGSFPLVQNLTKISTLEFANNDFSGTIPFSLLTLPFLSYLDLTDNHFTGPLQVPNSSTPSPLQLLFLGYNKFDGQILEPVSKLINLETLHLSFLNTSYPIDLSLFSSLKSLTYFDLSGNSISPASLNSDSDISLDLESLTMSFCGITEFPNILKNLQNLEFLDISNNRIRGKFPEWLWKLPRLSSVDISNNSLTGFEGPEEIMVNSSVRVLDVSLNKFQGALPSLPLSINVFNAEANSFTGSIPHSICNRTSLDALFLSYNDLTGLVPQCLSNMTIVSLRKNNLVGSIPDVFSVGASLRILDVGYNRLIGKLPRSLLNCSSLEFLSVDNNRIEDTFPFWLKALPSLQVLTLRSNRFYGPISPPHPGPLGFPELRIFEIADNKFTGSLSPSYFVNWRVSSLTLNEKLGLYMVYHHTYAIVIMKYRLTIDLRYKGLSMEQQGVLTSYAAIDFSGNSLEGQIPESIGLLKSLIAVNLSNNAFTGHIPVSLANLKMLESLDLSSNQLTGTIPNGLKTLSFLEYVNVSHNQLKGEIPQGTQIIGQPKSSFEGNAGLCGLPLKENCFGNDVQPTMQHSKNDEEEEEQVLNWKAVAVGYGSGVLLGLAIAQVIASYKPEWLSKIVNLNKRRNR